MMSCLLSVCIFSILMAAFTQQMNGLQMALPTLASYSAFSNIPSDCKIVVPDELYNSWISATNWSNTNVAKYIVKASEFNG